VQGAKRLRDRQTERQKGIATASSFMKEKSLVGFPKGTLKRIGFLEGTLKRMEMPRFMKGLEERQKDK
jgi:hypothetical protein